MKNNIIAVDFDGTLCENKYPEIGEPNMELIDFLMSCQLNGDKVILWTCRNEEQTKAAVDWCSERGLVFDAVNENLPEIITEFGGDTRKIFANVYIDDRNVSLYSCREKTSMYLWAENEIGLACEHEKSGDDGNGFSEYGCACYRSALKAFGSLMEDGHSGMSIGITKNILNRLIAGKPLTPIVDAEDIWSNHMSFEKNGEKSIQCKRMSSLFKHIKADSSVSYNDVSRAVCVSVNNPNNRYHSGLVDKIMDEMFPISMPYMPSTNPYYVYCEDFLYNTENGDFDTVGVFYVITPNGEKIKINRFFAEKDNKFEEIDIFKYDARKEAAEQLKKAGEKND